MGVSGVLSGLLSAWFVGPFYGINVVTVAFILRKLWPLRSRRLPQALILITALLISSCTAHAFIYLDDLIRGFAVPDSTGDFKDGIVNEYFLRVDRFTVLACFYLYSFNSFCNNLFVAWRVYVTWRRNLLFSVPLVVINVICLVIIGLVCHRFANHGSLEDTTSRAMVTSAWALSITIQISGALLIAWNTLQTPKIVEQKMRVLRTLFYACVESGFLSMVSEFFMVAFLYRNQPVALILVALLGQISGFSSFAIILRELQKAEQESAMGLVNVTSALAMHDFPHRRTRSRHSFEAGDHLADTVMVAIETSRHEDHAFNPTSKGFDPPAGEDV